MSIKTRISKLEASVPTVNDEEALRQQRITELVSRPFLEERAGWLASLPSGDREDVERYEAILDEVRREDTDQEPDKCARLMLMITHSDAWEEEAHRRFAAKYGRPRQPPSIAQHDWAAAQRRRP